MLERIRWVGAVLGELKSAAAAACSGRRRFIGRPELLTFVRIGCLQMCAAAASAAAAAPIATRNRQQRASDSLFRRSQPAAPRPAVCAPGGQQGAQAAHPAASFAFCANFLGAADAPSPPPAELVRRQQRPAHKSVGARNWSTAGKTHAPIDWASISDARTDKPSEPTGQPRAEGEARGPAPPPGWVCRRRCAQCRSAASSREPVAALLLLLLRTLAAHSISPSSLSNACSFASSAAQ